MLSQDEIRAILTSTLVDVFEIPEEKITGSANLYTDLDIDSIDAIDLIDQIRQQTGFKVQSEDFKAIRTADDVVNTLFSKQQEYTAGNT